MAIPIFSWVRLWQLQEQLLLIFSWVQLWQSQEQLLPIFSWVRLWQSQEQLLPIPTNVCSISVCTASFLIYTQMLMHVIVHRGCTNTIGESVLKVDREDNSSPHGGIKATSVLPLAFQSDALLTEPSCPLQRHVLLKTSQKVVDMSD